MLEILVIEVPEPESDLPVLPGGATDREIDVDAEGSNPLAPRRMLVAMRDGQVVASLGKVTTRCGCGLRIVFFEPRSARVERMLRLNAYKLFILMDTIQNQLEP